MEEEYVNCFSCGAKSLNFEGEFHEYMLAAPGCYEMFHEVLTREYSDFRYSRAHHYTVDSYAVQHPGEKTNRKAVNSAGIHLVSLYCMFEKNYEIERAAEIKMGFAQFNKDQKVIRPIDRPENFKGLTVFEIWDNESPDEHMDLCKQWALDSWEAWSNQRDTIELWAAAFLDERR